LLKKGEFKMTILSFKYNDLLDLKLKDFFYRLYDKAYNEEDLLSSAAQVAFYFTFALFPLLLFLISLFGIVLESADDLRTELFFYLSQAMPGSASDLVKKTIEEVTESSSGGKLTFGILIALYSASAGIDSIRVALNGVYNLTETRAWWRTKVLSIILTLESAMQGGKTGSLAALTKNKSDDNKNSSSENPAIETVNRNSSKNEISVNEKNGEATSKKSPLKLAAGLVVGLIENIFSSKKKP
jgi:hypothetical protein